MSDAAQDRLPDEETPRDKVTCLDAVDGCSDLSDCVCGPLECLGEAGSLCDAPCLALFWVQFAGVVAYAVRHRPADPHTAPPSSRAARMAWTLIRAYQLTVSAARPRPVCPMTPSCSRYGLEALSRHGLLRGGALTVRRLLRCSRRRPGADLVPG